MDAYKFLDGIFMMAALHNLSQHIEETAEAVSEDVLGPEGHQAFTKATEAEKWPVAYRYETGLLVIANEFHNDQTEHPIRLVCWADTGEKAWSEYAARWWLENNPALQEEN